MLFERPSGKGDITEWVSRGRKGPPTVSTCGKESRIWTDEGEYIDYKLGGGSLILGHGHPRVIDAVSKQINKGVVFSPPNETVNRLAHRVVDAVPCADQLFFTSTGTEATYLALRLARAYTNRRKVLKFAGAYHGWHDYGLQGSHKADHTILENSSSLPGNIDSAGIPHEPTEHVLLSPFNDLDRTRSIVAENHAELAAIIVEPVMRSIPPVEGFLQGLRDLCNEFNLLLIFDEVATGFRLAYGGAQEYFGILPDIATYGKVLGGGTPLAAVTGTQDVMSLLNSQEGSRSVIAGGTLRQNAIGAAAGLATLKELDCPGTYDDLATYTDALRGAVEDILTDQSVPVVTLGVGPMFDYALTDLAAVETWADVHSADKPTKRAIDLATNSAGILTKIGIGKRYVSTAHQEEDLFRTIEGFKEAVERSVC